MKYEIALFLSPKLTDEDVEKKSKDLEKSLTKFKAKVLELNLLGKKDLAYSIEHFEQGYLVVLRIEAQEDQIDKIKNKFREDSDIIRLMITKQEKKIKIDYKKKDKDKERDEIQKKEVSKEKEGVAKKQEDVMFETEDAKVEVKKDIAQTSGKAEEEDLDAKLDKILEEDIVD